MKTILVIGTNGFVGQNVLRILQKQNSYNLVTISGKKQIDIENSFELNQFCKNKNIDSIINCAAFVGGISYGYKYKADLLSKNTLMINNIYETAVKNNIAKVINPISNCAYPGNISEYKEEKFWDGKPDDSVFYYGLSKRVAVAMAEAYYEQYNISSVSIVLSNMYGPGDHFEEERSHALGALIKKFYDASTNNFESVEIWGSGNQIREWLYVEDGCNALIKSNELGKGNYFFNVGINKGISIKELANIIKKQLNFNGNLNFDTSKPEGVYKKQVDGTNGEKILKWKPEIGLEEGIAKTVKWYFDNYGERI